MPFWWLLCLGLLQATALLLILFLPLSWPWLALLLLLWLVGASHNLRCHTSRRLLKAVWQEQDAWDLYFADGRECSARLESRYFLRGPLLQLLLRPQQGPVVPLLILPGMLPGESLRRLKVRLRLFGGCA
jgi:hypothetical protein